MACMGLETNINGHDRCYPIYEMVIHWPPPPPNGDPLSHVVHDLTVIRTLNAAIARISDRGLRDNLTKAVQSSARSLELPAGMRLGGGFFQAQQPTRVLEHA